MSSSPPCCPDGSIPAHRGPFDHTGNVIDISSSGRLVQAYATGHADLASASHIVLVLSDVYGFDSGRHFQFADRLADLLNEDESSSFAGKAAIIVPDVFLGAPPFKVYRYIGEAASAIICAPGLVSNLRFRGAEQYLSPIYDDIFPWLKSCDVDFEKIQLSWVGFCFGGWLGSKCLARSNKENAGQLWNCGVGIHPSFIPEKFAGGTSESLAEAIKESKVLFMPARNDSDSLKPGGSVVKVLADARSVSESSISVPFENMAHGFCTRGDPSEKDIEEAQKLAEKTAANFILQSITSTSR